MLLEPATHNNLISCHIIALNNSVLTQSTFTMPSTIEQKGREKRYRQSDVLSDLENIDVMLGNFTENVYVNQPKY